MIKLIGGANLAGYFENRGAGYVAIGTGCANASHIRIMNGGLVFFEYVFAHFVARDAEFFGIGDLEAPVEGAPG